MQEGEGQKKWSTMKSTFFASSTTPSSSIQASMESKPRPPLEEVFEMEILLLFFFLLLLLLGEAEKNENWHSKPSDNFGEMGAWHGVFQGTNNSACKAHFCTQAYLKPNFSSSRWFKQNVETCFLGFVALEILKLAFLVSLLFFWKGML